MKKYFFALGTAMAVLAFAAAGCAESGASSGTKGSGTAPDFSLKTLEGSTVTLSQFSGQKSVLLVFGATWCPYCVKEIPELKEIYNNYKDKGLEVIYVDIQESAEKVGPFAEKHGIPYTVLLDEKGEVAASYNVYGIPHQVLISKDGTKMYEGPRPYNGIEALLKDNRIVEGG